MTGARLVAGLLAAAFVVGCMNAPAPQADPDPTLYGSAMIEATDRFCGDCHYGMQALWRQTWSDGNATVAPLYPEVPLLAIQKIPAEEPDTTWRSDILSMDATPLQPAAFTFDHRAGALFVRVHAQALPIDDPTASTGHDIALQAVLMAPDGTRHDMVGPEEDLQAIVVPDAATGTWRLEASPAAPANVVAWAEGLTGQIMPDRLTPGDELVYDADHRLRFRPHHDHAMFQNSEWDPYDMSPFTLEWNVSTTPPDLFTWNETTIAALWESEAAVVLERTGTWRRAYIEQPGHHDPGLGSSYPAFGPLGRPVLPGTRDVTFSFSWDPPVDIQPRLKFSPASTPYFFDAPAIETAPGQVVFAHSVQPAWWEEPDQVLAWLDPERVTSYWDVAPYIPADDGTLVAHDVTWALQMTIHQ